MADPLSIAASIAGLLSLTIEIGKVLGPYVSSIKETPSIVHHVHSEVHGTQVILAGLQKLVQTYESVKCEHAALVSVNQVVAILTDGVLLFSELETAIPSMPLGDANSQVLPLRVRIQWTRKEAVLAALIGRLQSFKSSMNLVLTILGSDTHQSALHHRKQLSANIASLLESNHDLSRRLMRLEDALDANTLGTRTSFLSTSAQTVQPIDASNSPTSLDTSAANSRESTGSLLFSNFDFEGDLEASRVYRRAKRNTMDFSFRSSIAPSHAWSALSGLSLSQVSAISVIALPVSREELANARHYDFGNGVQSAGRVLVSEREDPLIIRCYDIASLMRQIPGCQGYFSQGKCESMGAFDELWEILRQLEPLVLLLRALGMYSLYTEPVASIDNRAEKVIFYCHLAIEADHGSEFDVNDLMGNNIYGFCKVIRVVSILLQRLVVTGLLSPRNFSLKTLFPQTVARNRHETELQVSRDEFLAGQRLFIGQLDELTQLKDELRAGGLNLKDSNEIFGELEGLISLHTRFLLILEQNLFRPLKEQEWSQAFGFYHEHIDLEASFIANERKACSKLKLCIAQGRCRFNCASARGEASSMLTHCLRGLSLPGKRLVTYGEFLDEWKSLYRRENSGESSFDLTRAESALIRARSDVSSAVKSNETSEALKELNRRVLDWKTLNPNMLGELLLYDLVRVRPPGERLIRVYYTYLFECILLVCKAKSKIDKKYSVEKSEASSTGQERDLEIVGSIFLRDIDKVVNYSGLGVHRCEVMWRKRGRLEKGTSFLMDFASKSQLSVWSSKIESNRAKRPSIVGEL